MIVPILAEYAMVFDDENLYQFICKLITELFDDLYLQIWFPKEEMETLICTSDYSRGEDKSKVSVTLYEDVEEFKKEIVTEIELFGKEKNFEIFRAGFATVAYAARRHYRSQPFPLTWRNIIKSHMSKSHKEDEPNEK